ncbi:hypothetical protein CR207_09845 [Chromobacterium violaceum]|nr:hypothetical protein CR207_09845 [Chromobacterium violaceum]
MTRLTVQRHVDELLAEVADRLIDHVAGAAHVLEVAHAACSLRPSTLAGAEGGIHALVWALGLFLFAGACWLPVVWLQIRMAGMARDAAEAGQALPARYWRFARIWEYLGYPAFCAMLAVYFLMVLKPDWS